MQPLQASRPAGAARAFLKRAILVGLGWIWVAATVWLSLTPSPPQVEFRESDKVGHVLAYGLLMFWFAELYARRLFLALGFIAMGVGLEFVQGMLGYRTFDVLDMLANTVGVVAGWAFALVLPEKAVRTLFQQIKDDKNKKGS